MQYFELGFFFQIKQQKGRKPPRVFMNEFCRHRTPEAHGGVKGGRGTCQKNRYILKVSKEHRKESWKARKSENPAVTEGAKTC